jgi:predicted AlkP superfamily phosphohydrolase/phosphomutase
MSVSKVFVFGLDGATFDLILPWAAEGRLPHFSRLLAEGCWAPLESAPNMRSAAAWTSFITGKNPGKHGIFEFYEPIPGTYEVRFIHGGMREGKSLWAILSQLGKRVGVINVPMTYPAEEVNGFLIAGLDAPSPESPYFCYPAELSQELHARFGPYILEPGLTGCLIGGKPDAAVQKFHEELEQKEKITAYLMQKYPWDFFMVVFRSLDAVQHCFWKHMDPFHPHHNPAEAKRYGSVILKAYQKIDKTLGTIRAALDEDTALIVMSDHGFGRKHPASNQLNRWLASQGFLHYLDDRGPGTALRHLLTSLFGHTYRLLVGKTSRRVKQKLARRFPQLRNRLQSRLCLANIDWSRTKAYSDTLFPNIRVNLEGREPKGIVNPGEDYYQLIDEIRQGLVESRDAVSGRQIVDRVFHRDELYTGPLVEKAPDLLIRWKEDEEIHGIALADGALDSALPEESRPLVPGEDPHVISGDHRLFGVLLMAGKPIRRGVQCSPARLIDLAPTILQLLKLPIPSAMDGRVLTKVFQEGIISTHAPFRINEVPETSDHQADEGYSVEEEKAIAQRLRDLGYVD